MARATPKERVADACLRWGDSEVVDRCMATLESDPDHAVTGLLLELSMELTGGSDPDWLAGGKPPGHRYWARVWAARALLYVWEDRAAPAVVQALGDEHWRVREMSAKVINLRELPDAGDRLAAVITDPVPRVRAAACKALGTVGEGEHASPLRDAMGDAEPIVAAAAERAMMILARRLDRPL